MRRLLIGIIILAPLVTLGGQTAITAMEIEKCVTQEASDLIESSTVDGNNTYLDGEPMYFIVRQSTRHARSICETR